jgi:hypothetical protein
MCTNDSDIIPTINLSVNKKVDAISDSIYFKDIDCMAFHNGLLFFTNPVFDNIVCTDHNFELRKIIGVRGKGPNNLLGIQQFAICDSVLCVSNGGNRRVNLYNINNGDIISEKKLTESVTMSWFYRIGFDGEFTYSGAYKAEKPFSAYNINDGAEKLFGENYTFSSKKQTSIRNDRYVFSSDSLIYAVSDNLPIIETYSKQTKQLIDKYDYSSINHVKEEMEFINSKKYADNEYATICNDIYLTDNNFYVLLTEIKEGFFINKIIKFYLEPSITPVAIYQLPGKIYHAFCVSETENCIFAFEYKSNSIEKLLLPTN